MAVKITKLCKELKFGDEFDIAAKGGRGRSTRRVKICSSIKSDRGLVSFSVGSTSIVKKSPAIKMSFLASAQIEVYKVKIAEEEMQAVLGYLEPEAPCMTAIQIATTATRLSDRLGNGKFSKRKTLILLHRAAIHGKVILKKNRSFLLWRLPLEFRPGLLITKNTTKEAFRETIGGWVENVITIQGALTPIVRWENGLSSPVNEQMVEPVANLKVRDRILAAKARYEGRSSLPEGHKEIPYYLWSGLIKGYGNSAHRVDQDSLLKIAHFIGLVEMGDDRPLTLFNPARKPVTDYLDVHYPGWIDGKYDHDRESRMA